MTLLSNYAEQSFLKFAYHDGALEGLDHRKKLKFLEKSRELCARYNLQHIITYIDSDTPRDASDNTVEFNADEIILELHDKDESGLLFQKKF